MPVPKLTSGEVAHAADVQAQHEFVRDLLNNLQVENLRPESIGAQHVEGLVVAADSVEQPSSSAWTVTTHAVVAPEPQAQIIAAWAQNPSLLLNNGGAGYTIPKPFILIECMTYRIDQFVQGGGAPAPFAEDGLFVNLYKQSNGGTSEVSPLVTRYHRATAVETKPIATYFPGDAFGHSPTILRVTSYTGTGNYILNHLQMRAICVPRAAGVGPDAIVRNGRLWFMALRIPG